MPTPCGRCCAPHCGTFVGSGGLQCGRLPGLQARLEPWPRDRAVVGVRSVPNRDLHSVPRQRCGRGGAGCLLAVRMSGLDRLLTCTRRPLLARPCGKSTAPG
jgi:hypothetical protein